MGERHIQLDAVSVPCPDNLMAPLLQEQTKREESKLYLKGLTRFGDMGIAFHFLYVTKSWGQGMRHLVNILE